VANIKSQIKRIRQNEKRRARNKGIRTALRSSTKKVRTSAESGNAEVASSELRATARQIDKAVSRGALHKRTAARRKSRLARTVGSPPAQAG
jgi:small subunit ribosomal protein S20